MLAPGHLTLLHGPHGVGKTTLAAALLNILSKGGQLADLAVRPGRALVVTEESSDDWQQRLPGLRRGGHICFLSRPARARATDDWPLLLEHVRDLTRALPFEVVVIDPLAAFVTAPGSPIADLRSWGQSGPAWLVLHDEPASGGNPTLAAQADVAIAMEKTGTEPQRRLTVRSSLALPPSSRLIDCNETGSYRTVVEGGPQSHIRVEKEVARRRRGVG